MPRVSGFIAQALGFLKQFGQDELLLQRLRFQPATHGAGVNEGRLLSRLLILGCERSLLKGADFNWYRLHHRLRRCRLRNRRWGGDCLPVRAKLLLWRRLTLLLGRGRWTIENRRQAVANPLREFRRTLGRGWRGLVLLLLFYGLRDHPDNPDAHDHRDPNESRDWIRFSEQMLEFRSHDRSLLVVRSSKESKDKLERSSNVQPPNLKKV